MYPQMCLYQQFIKKRLRMQVYGVVLEEYINYDWHTKQTDRGTDLQDNSISISIGCY